MKRKICTISCILLIASLLLLGCKSENAELRSESNLHTEVASEQESEKISTESLTTEEISTESLTTEELSTQEINTEVETESSDSQNTASNQGSNNNTNASQPTQEQNAPQPNAPQQNTPQQSTPDQSAPEPPAPEPEPVPQAPYFNEAYEQAVLDQVNQVRQGLGLSPLTLNTTLVNAAHTRSMEIVEQASHTRPDGRSCFTAWDDAGVSYISAGENIAAGQQTPEAVMEDWINSPGHYANIIDENFTELAVGCYYVPGSTYGYYWVQCFNTP